MGDDKIAKAIEFLESVIDSYEESTAIKVQAAKILADVVFRRKLHDLEARVDSLVKRLGMGSIFGGDEDEVREEDRET